MSTEVEEKSEIKETKLSDDEARSLLLSAQKIVEFKPINLQQNENVELIFLGESKLVVGKFKTIAFEVYNVKLKQKQTWKIRYKDFISPNSIQAQLQEIFRDGAIRGTRILVIRTDSMKFTITLLGRIPPDQVDQYIASLK